jgi:hypothetical protein
MHIAFLKLARFAPLALLVAFGAVAVHTIEQGAGKYPRLETQLLGSNKLLADSPASLRVICRDHLSGKEVAGATVKVTLGGPDGEAHQVFSGRTARNGTMGIDFRVPDVSAGAYTLNVVASGLGETDRLDVPVTIAKPVGILVATDKPLYQPGQLIHIRTLSIWGGNGRPAAGLAATIEVEDSKGNKVFKQALETNDFGVAAADFQLADEINMGPYKIRALVGDSQEEKTVTVDRYVLPKFKVGLETDREYYTPGAVMSGSTSADYVFGKPVVGGSVEMTFSSFDVGFTEFARVTGKTDAQGRFQFEQKLPDHFVGQPLEQGNALVQVSVKVTDTADHEQQLTRSLPVAGSGMILALIPERKTVLRNADIGVFAMASTPDGRPVQNAELWLGEPEKPLSRSRWTTDEAGLVEIRLPRTLYHTAALGGTYPLVVSGKSPSGDMGRAGVDLQMGVEEEGILLRPFRTLVRVGEPLYCEALVAGPNPTRTVYFDVVKDGRSVLTRAEEATNGVARLMLHPTDDMAGTIRVQAYRLTYSGQIVRDTRVVFVSPSSDLAVQITLDQETYRPGETAKLRLQVGRKGASAVGLSIVDESVFALQEMRPGMERVYFLLEQELLHPRYEIHGIEPGSMFQPAGYSKSTQLAARALFAQAEPIGSLGIDENSYIAKLTPFMEGWVKRVEKDARAIMEAGQKWHDVHADKNSRDTAEQLKYPNADAHWQEAVSKGWLSAAHLKDEWGRKYRLTPIYNYLWRDNRQQENGTIGVVVQSAGLDGRFGGFDDFAAIAYFQGSVHGIYARDTGRFNNWAMAGGGPAAQRLGGFGAARGGLAGADLELAEAPGAIGLMEGLAMDASDGAAKGVPRLAAGEEAQAPRMRQYFPETMYWNPSIITDENGRASLEIPLADSITTWRVSAGAVDRDGRMGSATVPLRVFQDFFVDIDLPVYLTQNDEVSIPVAVYNYLPGQQSVELRMEASKGIEFLSEETQSVTMGANDVRAVYFRFRVTGLGRQTLTVHAKGDRLADAMRRDIEVVPDGRRETTGISERLKGNVERTLHIPENAVDGGNNLLVKIYPGIMATVVEGLDSLLRMPFGCFEQTSSVTYPNVLVLDYMKQTKQVTPEIQMKAEQYINLGYQRLLSFEVQGGGFEWFGNAPANKVLTAYGLLEFADMSRVYGADPAVLARTQAWLEKAQNQDGSWDPDKGGIAEGAINRQTDTFKTTAYIAWAIAESGSESGALRKSLGWLAKNLDGATDPYALALAANALLKGGDRANGTKAINALLAKVKRDGNLLYFSAEGTTAVNGRGRGGDVETTAIALLALLKAGGQSNTVNKLVDYLIQSKDPSGTWYSTQATVFALKALIAATLGAGADMDGEGRVFVNGELVGTFVITPQNYEVMRQFDAKNLVRKGDNKVRIEYSGNEGPMFQIAGIYYMPWDAAADDRPKEMDIQVKFDKTELAANDTVTARVRVVYNGRGAAANMVIVDLGTPPGFDVMAGDLQELVGSKVIQKFSLTGRQAILYFERLEKGKPVEFEYRLRAKYPLRARTPASRIYEYYDPDAVAYSPPQLLRVSGAR